MCRNFLPFQKSRSVIAQNALCSYHAKTFRARIIKVKVVPYTFVRRGVPVREDTYPESWACEVGWPVPFLAARIINHIN